MIYQCHNIMEKSDWSEFTTIVQGMYMYNIISFGEELSQLHIHNIIIIYYYKH